MAKQKGLLLAMMEPPAGFEEEFQDWYDTEHVPERLALKEFETGRRFVCYSGFPRYLALYDLVSLDKASENPTYKKCTGNTVSAWTHRLRTKVLGRFRFTGHQIYPGTALMAEKTPVIRLLLLRFRGAKVSEEKQMLSGLLKNFAKRLGVSQIRLFRGEETPGDYIATIEFNTNASDVLVDPAAFGKVAGKLDLINAYAPYWRQIVHRKA